MQSGRENQKMQRALQTESCKRRTLGQRLTRQYETHSATRRRLHCKGSGSRDEFKRRWTHIMPGIGNVLVISPVEASKNLTTILVKVWRQRLSRYSLRSMVHVRHHEVTTFVLVGPMHTCHKNLSFVVVRVLRWLWQRVDQGEATSLKIKRTMSSSTASEKCWLTVTIPVPYLQLFVSSCCHSLSVYRNALYRILVRPESEDEQCVLERNKEVILE